MTDEERIDSLERQVLELQVAVVDIITCCRDLLDAQSTTSDTNDMVLDMIKVIDGRVKSLMKK